MTPAEVTTLLRQFNGWRRDFEDKFEQPDPHEVSEAIDAAVEMIERLEAAEEDRSNFVLEMGRLCAQCDALRAKIEQMEKQKPVVSVWRCDNGHIHGSCEQTLPMGAKLYALPGAQGEIK
jgi:hypothetical protein